MAKVGFWLQGSTGKLAGSALQKGVNGTVIRQITKTKNPKTANQILQRVLMNTCSQAYSALQPILCHSFQGKTEGAQCMAEFQKQNLAYFRERAANLPEDQLNAFVNFVPVGQKGVRLSQDFSKFLNGGIKVITHFEGSHSFFLRPMMLHSWLLPYPHQ